MVMFSVDLGNIWVLQLWGRLRGPHGALVWGSPLGSLFAICFVRLGVCLIRVVVCLRAPFFVDFGMLFWCELLMLVLPCFRSVHHKGE